MHHVVACDHHFFLFALLPPFVQNCVELFFCLLLSVTKRGGFFKILCFDRCLLFKTDLFDFLLNLLNIGRSRHGVDVRPRARFVHDIHGFVGEKTSRDITIGESDRGLERFIGEFRFVVGLVFRAQSFQDLDRFVHGRCIHLYGLETAFQRGVLLDIFAVFVHCRRADTLQFPTAERRFDDVRGIHCALG